MNMKLCSFPPATTVSIMPKHIFVVSSIFLFLASCSVSQTPKTWPTPVEVKPQGVSVVDGKFRSESGRFSISIPAMPMKTLDIGTEKARAKGVDAGKNFVWQFATSLYTIMYTPPVDSDGRPDPNDFNDMVIGTRKGVLNAKGKIISEKPFEFGEYSGTELRYTAAEKVNYIGRIFIFNGYGYAVTGAYLDGNEKEVLDVLNSFKATSVK